MLINAGADLNIQDKVFDNYNNNNDNDNEKNTNLIKFMAIIITIVSIIHTFLNSVYCVWYISIHSISIKPCIILW